MTIKPLDQSGAIPLYIQLSNELWRLIQEGVWKPGEQIISEQGLCETYQVSRVTVRKAIDLLIENKTLFRKQGKGTYVSYPDFFSMPYIREQSFTGSEIHGNAVPHTHVLHKTIIPVTTKLKDSFHMECPIGEQLISLLRIRYLDEDPVILETDYFPIRFHSLLDRNLEDKSLYGLIHEKLGVESLNVRDSFFAVSASPQAAEALSVSTGHPLLRVLQTVLDNHQQVIYYNEQLIKSENYEYKMESLTIDS